MAETKEAGLRKIRRALISVSDKSGIVDLARQLEALDVEIISTGGTAKALREAGIDVRDVSDLTGFPEMMDGRVKTLHPKVHGGLLAVRDNEEHQAAMRDHAIEPIDLVVINLYPFEETIARDGVTLEQAIEQIDIGGPAMIRSAAKNYRDVAVVTSSELYQQIQEELAQHDGALTLATRSQLARLAFMRTAFYDSTIFPYLASQFASNGCPFEANYAPVPEVLQVMTTYMNLFTSTMKALHPEEESGNGHAEEFELHADIPLKKISDLRYGENPHQSAALYEIDSNLEDLPPGLAHAELISGKEMSFNNYVDADAAWQLVWDFDETACAIIKHTNPAGVALGTTAE
ncbi:MAG TPA: hypothetical protein VGW36_03835, partial [Pyrinomonadaceae bacterium]|nr:hypothetical protein [Pyrinomonadaceae bacterium]